MVTQRQGLMVSIPHASDSCVTLTKSFPVAGPIFLISKVQGQGVAVARALWMRGAVVCISENPRSCRDGSGPLQLHTVILLLP